LRLGANIIVIGGVAYQSHGWRLHRPLGSLSRAMEALNRYQVDEINVISLDQRYKSSFKATLNNLLKATCQTPTVFGGGINAHNIDFLLESLPTERYSFSNCFLENNLQVIKKIKENLGNQAIVGVMPLRFIGQDLQIFNSMRNSFEKLKNKHVENFYNFADEIMVFDVAGDGLKTGFDFSLLEILGIENEKIIISGGITKKDLILAKKNKIAAVYVDNSVLHKEFGGDFL